MTRRKSTKRKLDWRGWPPFALPGHHWTLAEWITSEFEHFVIRRWGNGTLVRDGNVRRCFPEPTESPSKIQSWSSQEEEEWTTKFFKGDQGPMANLFVRAKVSTHAQDSLYIKANELLDMLVELAPHDRNAAQILLAIAGKAVGSLNRIAEDKPDHLRPLAELATCWPVMMSTHPHLCDDHKSLFKRIQLGRKTPIEIDQCSKWKLDAAAKIALALLRYMLALRRDNCTSPLANYARPLPEFDDDTATKWWAVAEQFLFLSYPRETFDRVPELAALVTTPSKRRSPGRMRQEIIDKLRARFFALAKTPAAYRS